MLSSAFVISRSAVRVCAAAPYFNGLHDPFDSDGNSDGNSTGTRGGTPLRAPWRARATPRWVLWLVKAVAVALTVLGALWLAGCATTRAIATPASTALAILGPWERAWEAGDVDALMALYDPKAIDGFNKPFKVIRRDYVALFERTEFREIEFINPFAEPHRGRTFVVARYRATIDGESWGGVVQFDVASFNNRPHAIVRSVLDQGPGLTLAELQVLAKEKDGRLYPSKTDSDPRFDLLQRSLIADAADFGSTAFCMVKHGVGGELNPIVRWCTTALTAVGVPTLAAGIGCSLGVKVVGRKVQRYWVEKMLEGGDDPTLSVTIYTGGAWLAAVHNIIECAT